MTTKQLSAQDMKEKIDGYFAMVVDGCLTADDAHDAINDLIGRPNGHNKNIYDELHDYKFESMNKFSLCK